MEKVMKLHNYKGEEHLFVVPDVEHIFCAVRYDVSGDECALIIYEDGATAALDVNDMAADGDERILSCGPEDMCVVLAADIVWEPTHAA